MVVDVEEIFETLNEQKGIAHDEFEQLVESKVDTLGGLCDYETAAKLVAHDLGVNPEVEFKDIAEISGEDEYVSFVGKIVQVGDAREFNRDDGSVGRVANLQMADETGEIRMAVWDQLADMVKVGELERGEVMRVEGAQVREGQNGVEVSVTGQTELERDDSEIEVRESFVSVENLEPGLGSVHVKGEVLEVGETRTFDRDDGSEGRVRTVKIGDETGRVSVSLWGEKAGEADDLEPGEAVAVRYGYTRERYGDVELHVGDRGYFEEADDVEYRDQFTPVDDVTSEGSYDVKAKVTAVDDVHTFDRDDGSTGKVANLHLEDETGSIRAAAWDEMAEEIQELSPGDTAVVRDAAGRQSRDGSPELSLGWRSSIEVQEGAGGPEGKGRYIGPIVDMPGGSEAEVEGRVVTWSGVLDDGTGCVSTSGKPLPFGRWVHVNGFSESRGEERGLRVEEAEPRVGADVEEVERLLDRLEGL